MTSPYDLWKTTAPDCYEPNATARCVVCDDVVELVDMEWTTDDVGVCCRCWHGGARPEGWDGDDASNVDPPAGTAT